MRHIKKFESFEFDLGNYPVEDTKDADCEPCEDGDEFPGGEWYPEDEFNPEDYEDEHEREEEAEEHERRRLWGDESTVERISSFVNFLSEAKKSKGVSYEKSGLKHPEKADLDKDKKISSYEKKRGKAVQDSVQDEKEEGKNNKKDNKKEDDKKPKFGSKEWREKYTKKK